MLFEPWVFGSYEMTVLIKLFLAALAGGLIGLEREKHGRPAGLRTHWLVALGACLMMIISEAFDLKYGGLPGSSVVRIDPGRIAAQIVAGIGFIGAGVILKEGLSVRGLTTAACLWLAAGVGMGFGMGAMLPSIMATGLGIGGLIFLKKLEPFIKKDRYLVISVTADSEDDIYPELERIFLSRRMEISNLSGSFDSIGKKWCYEFTLTQHQRRMGKELTTIIAEVRGVRSIRFK